MNEYYCMYFISGTKNRALGSHSMNEHSSRGHTLLTVYIEIESKTIGDNGEALYITRHGKINFVDLAGSEMVKKTKSSGKALTEANNINKSLMVLGNCISALSKSGDRKVHIPYRDSKLTKLLADSLSGNGITLMVCYFFFYVFNSILQKKNIFIADCLCITGCVKFVRNNKYVKICREGEKNPHTTFRHHGSKGSHDPQPQKTGWHS